MNKLPYGVAARVRRRQLRAERHIDHRLGDIEAGVDSLGRRIDVLGAEQRATGKVLLEFKQNVGNQNAMLGTVERRLIGLTGQRFDPKTNEVKDVSSELAEFAEREGL